MIVAIIIAITIFVISVAFSERRDRMDRHELERWEQTEKWKYPKDD